MKTRRHAPATSSNDHDFLVKAIMEEAGLKDEKNFRKFTSVIEVVSLPLQELNARIYGPITEQQFSMLKRLATNKPNIYIDIFSQKEGYSSPIRNIDNRADFDKIEVMEEDERSSYASPQISPLGFYSKAEAVAETFPDKVQPSVMLSPS